MTGSKHKKRSYQLEKQIIYLIKQAPKVITTVDLFWNNQGHRAVCSQQAWHYWVNLITNNIVTKTMSLLPNLDCSLYRKCTWRKTHRIQWTFNVCTLKNNNSLGDAICWPKNLELLDRLDEQKRAHMDGRVTEFVWCYKEICCLKLDVYSWKQLHHVIRNDQSWTGDVYYYYFLSIIISIYIFEGWTGDM